MTASTTQTSISSIQAEPFIGVIHCDDWGLHTNGRTSARTVEEHIAPQFGLCRHCLKPWGGLFLPDTNNCRLATNNERAQAQ